MELIRDIHCLKQKHKPCVLTIGNFDGVHLGHRTVIDQLVGVAQQKGLPATVMIFEPQPQEYFSRRCLTDRDYPLRLMTFRQKVQALARLNIDYLVCVNFNRSFSSVTATQFIDQYLCQGLGVRHLVIGDDFRFGRGREGDFQRLVEKGREQGFTVTQAATFEWLGSRVSSTRIRQLIGSADLEVAEQLLTKPYSLTGRVIMGRQLGRQLGIPTANIELDHQYVALAGVYVVTVIIDSRSTNDRVGSGKQSDEQPNEQKAKRYSGVANLGLRPTVNKAHAHQDDYNTTKNVYLESHLLDFTGDLYGQRITVELRHKLREEKNFASVAELKTAIEKDIQQAKEWFK